jgi:hypothetical protein
VIKKGEKRVELELPRSTSIKEVLLEACRRLGFFNDYDFHLYPSPYKDEASPFLDEARRLEELFPRKKKLVLYLRKKDTAELSSSPSSSSALGLSSSGSSLNFGSTSSAGGPGEVPTAGIISSLLPLFSRTPELKRRFKQDSVYLSALLFNSNKQVLLTSSGLLPSFEIPSETLEEPLGPGSEDFHWMLKKSLDWENQVAQKGALELNLQEEVRGLNEIRRAFLMAVGLLRDALGPQFFGMLHDEPIVLTRQEVTYLVIMKDVTNLPQFAQGGGAPPGNPGLPASPSLPSFSSPGAPGSQAALPEALRSGTLSWRTVSDLNPAFYPPTSNVWMDFGRIYKERTTPIPPGLYVSLFYPSNARGLTVLASKTRRSGLPSHPQYFNRLAGWLASWPGIAH